MTRLQDFAWPLSRLDEAVELLARRTGPSRHIASSAEATSLLQADVSDADALGRSIERLLVGYGLEVDACVLRYSDVTRMTAPVIVRLADAGEPAFLVVGRRRGGTMLALSTNRRWRRLRTRDCAEILRSPVGSDERRDIQMLLDAAGVAPGRRSKVSRALLDAQLSDVVVANAWRVIAEPAGDFTRLLRHAGVFRNTIALVVLHAAQFVLWIVSWALIGRGALEGRTDWGWLTAWLLLLATVVPLQVWTTWKQGELALALARLLKERLLAGALRVDPEEVRHQGAGELLGRVLESDAVESLAIGGGLQAGLAIIELVLAAGVLWMGAGGAAHVFALFMVVLAATSISAAYYRRRVDWSLARLEMTNQLVERVAGHRTRMAQEDPKEWHQEEDRRLEDYVARSSALDRWTSTLLVAVPRGWLALAVAILTPLFVSGSSATSLAVSLGGVLLATLALRRFADGLTQLAGAGIAWRQAEPLFAAAERSSTPAVADETRSDAITPPAVLDVRDLTFQYPTRSSPALVGCSLRAGAGDRLLLQGPSGGGKSTFASIVAGIRDPNAGLVLIDGLDRRSLGAHGWRRRAVAVPQFHENHVFCETFAFNLLMGRRWPPSDADLEDADAIARELGLSDLLSRMPAGLMQQVGEGGWQLSHGERSRLFMARALLQRGNVMILDESFAALDPETLRQTLECVLRRAPTLMVIAHP